MEKKPIYVINISVVPEDVDNCIEPTKSVVHLRNKSSLVSFLSSVLERFLVKNGFSLPKESIVQASPSPRKRKKLEGYQFDDSGYAESTSNGEISLEDQHHTLVLDSTTFYTTPDAPSQEIMWTDASTGERFSIDSRTGHSYRQSEYLPEHVEASALNREGRLTFTLPKIDSLAPTKRGSNEELGPVPVWLEHAFKRNQAYDLTESRIPCIKPSHFLDHIAPIPGYFPDKHGCHISQKLEIGCDNLTLQFTKDDLRRVEVINQVDKKFIACRITKRHSQVDDRDREPSPILILVDQHAADERVRVERFLKDLCLGFLHQDQTDNNSASKYNFTRDLAPSHPVLLTQHEALTISQSQSVQESFRKWGVRFTELSKIQLPGSDGAPESGSNTGYLQVYVGAIPEVVGDKLLQGDELRDFIKGFLSQIQNGELLLDSSLDFPSNDPEDLDEYFWLKAVRKCPKGLLDLINSKACRGAIMFNDLLSVPQCTKLMKHLSETAFPFQCAHGRPSIVPLVDAGTLLARKNKRKRPQNDWTKLGTIKNQS